MFKVFLAVLAALLVFKCVSAAEPDPYEQFKAHCEEVNVDQGAPAGWCDCLVAGLRERVPADDLAQATSPFVQPDVYLRVRQQLVEVASACRAKFRGDTQL